MRSPWPDELLSGDNDIGSSNKTDGKKQDNEKMWGSWLSPCHVGYRGTWLSPSHVSASSAGFFASVILILLSLPS